MASRLCCLWVTDNSEKSKKYLKKMLGKDIYIFEVILPKILRITKTDTKWFDKYCEKPNEEYIKNYWKGIPFSESEESWEYLVEGYIQIKNKENLEYIRLNGQKVPEFIGKHFKNDNTAHNISKEIK